MSADEHPPCPDDIRRALGGSVGPNWVQEVVERIGDIPQAHIEVVLLRKAIADAEARGQVAERLTREREAELRADSESSYLPAPHRVDLAELLAEIDALRAEQAEAEARGRAAERADVVAHLADKAGTWIAGAIERGDHIRGKR